LISLLMYIMGFYSLHESLHQEVTKLLSRFFWAGENNKQKYHMVKWSEIYKPKDQGGLGVISSKRMNIALLSKWLWRIQTEEGGLWLQIIRGKYLRGQLLAFASRSGGSQFWQSVMSLLPILRIGTSIQIGSGAATLFWLDKWAGPRPFAERFVALFSICVRP
uniref:Reverse transcriptase zinc-binding domain-containing protein n=1 Tax=Aegilops tauschii subsp. strangulata TaxID=200361 RepID=A0A452ZZZ2_AEGTS